MFFDEEGTPRRFPGSRTRATSDAAIERLALLAERDEPWLMVVSYQDPHYPLQPESGYAALFEHLLILRKPGQVETYRHLLIAQDSGAAIKGPARGDVFFGGGANAADWAGRMVGKGQAIVLVPNRG